MPVNGQDGQVLRADIAQYGGKFFTFQQAVGGIIAGTELGTMQLRSEIGTWTYKAFLRAPGDALFTPVGTVDLLANEYEADDLLATTGGFENMVPAGATASIHDLYNGVGQYTSPVDGQVYLGQFGLLKWLSEVLGGMTNLAIEQATQVAFGGAMVAREQAALNGMLAGVTVTPYVAPAGPSETTQFPPAAKTITAMFGLLTAQRLQATMTAGPDGMPVVGLAPPPT